MAKASKLRTRIKPTLFDYSSPGLDRFGIVLGLTSLLLVLLLSLDINVDGISQNIGSVVVAIATATILSYSLRASGFNRRYSMIIGLLLLFGVLATLTVAIINMFVPHYAHYTPPHSMGALWVIVAGITPIATTYRLLQHREVTVRTLAAALSAYLQIAVAFTFAYLLIDNYTNSNFFGHAEASTTFMYFSLVTISTLGYGDFSATGTIGHAASALEAVIGQIYLVVVVAMLVGLYTSNRQPLSSKHRNS